MDEATRIRLIELTAEVVAAYVSNNSVPSSELGSLIGRMHETLTATAAGGATAKKPKEPLVPAVSIKRSVQPDYIISLEDGKKFKSLKRHLMAHYNMTPDDYRAKWELPADYPMVAPNYSASRSVLAKSSGLGRKAAPPPPPAPAKRGRKKVAELSSNNGEMNGEG